MSSTSTINDIPHSKLSVRLVSADSYQFNPISLDPCYSDFRGSEIKQVPVIRIFGTTINGKKICLHIHGVFPYFYIPCTNNNMTDYFVYHLAASLDSALNISLGSANANTQHIYKIQQVTGIPFYGYHKKRHKFFKIYFYSPAMIKRAAELLQNGSIMNQTFQPHEAHIPFILQFMMDYNIYGMSFIDLKNVYYRKDTQLLSSDTLGEELSVLESREYLSNSVLKQSTCELEADAIAGDIINRQAIENGIDTNPGIAAIWEEEKLRRTLAGLSTEDSDLVCPLTQERQVELPPTDNDIYQQERFLRRILRVSQNSESNISSQNSSEAYPVVVDENEDLLNASNIQDHLSGSRSDEQLNVKDNEHSVEELSNSLPSDMTLAEMLAELANDAESQTTIDNDSILGSQSNVIEKEEYSSGDEDEVPDLNLTNLQLDSLNSWDFRDDNAHNDKPQSQKSSTSTDTVPPQMFDLDFSLMDVSKTEKKSNKKIPAFDGPCDSTSSDSEKEVDVTIENVLACAYKPSKKKINIVTITPTKKDDPENCNSPSKRRKLMDYACKTPTRSSRKVQSLNSPSSSRTYSPLNVQVVTSPKVDSLPKKVYTEQMKKELNVLKSIKQTKDVATLLEMQDDDVLAEDSDDSSLKGTNESPIVTRKKSNKKINKHVARKLKFHKLKSNSQDETTINNSEKNQDTISETSESISDIESIKLHISLSANKRNSSNNLHVTESCDKYVSIRPRYEPPSKNRIIATMVLYGIPKCRYQEPFYNNEEDMHGQKEVAHKILKIPSKGLSSLQQFVSNLEGICGIDHWRNSKIKIFENSQGSFKLSNDKRSLVGHTLLKIVPLIQPPSRKRVENWIKAKKYLRRKKDKEEEEGNLKVGCALPLEKCSFREEEIGDDDKTICASPCYSENTLIEETEVINPKIPTISQEIKSSNEMKSSSEMDSLVDESVQKILDNTKLLASLTTSRHCGVSCGQIEFSSNSTRDNIDAENLHAKALAKNQFITIMCLEIHIETRDEFVPDPQKDVIKAVFYAVQNDVPPTSSINPLDHGVIVFNNEESDYLPKNYANVTYVKSEKCIIEEIILIVTRYDPEILIGWELENLSWGYIFQRATVLGLNFSSRISRIPRIKYNWEAKTLDLESLADFKLPGRIVLEIWRTMRHELALNSYSFENIMYHVMNERLPYYSWQTLTEYWKNPSQRSRCKVVDYYSKKVVGMLRILEHLDIIGRTSEFARLYGVQFYEVFSRGSQFRVESMMLRLAKPFNYIPVSPSNNQRAAMRAPEALPLIMEPESCLYSDPIVVLDFQSLYPSIIIAYNYCFSTCAGRVEYIGQSQPFPFGATTLKINHKLASELQGKLNFSPCGIAFVKPEVRRGVLPQMLSEILNTRLMVKKAMKDHSSQDKTLQRVLHSRQLGLKLIANVTYGYTAANFSGRMPCIEVGDSVVSKGKETLERAIQIVESTAKWNARVVYGDTDSLFILLKGKTRKEAFEIGYEMANVITEANPAPVKLKFEKVLQPSILQTKKRYCGYMYENINDEKPVYLAKGIETVRRDGCPAVSKILAKSLKILFETKDVSQIKQYVTRQFDKILQGKVSIDDLTFAREFRGLRGYRANACVPALELTRRLMKRDPRCIPRNHERVKYVIVAGAPNEALIRCVRTPMEVIKDPGLRPNATYYITRVIIPPLNRCLNLIGADANLWFNEMPHRQGQRCLEKVVAQAADKQKITISQYFDSAMCIACGKQTAVKEICEDCKLIPGETIIVLTEKIRQTERINQLVNRLCHSCVKQVEEIKCESLDCPIFYRRQQSIANFTRTSVVYKLMNSSFNLDF